MTKLVFFGNEKLATGIPDASPLIRESLRKAGYEVEVVVTERAVKLPPHTAKLGVLAAYGKILPQSMLNEFPLGIINVHPSLLPIYRGPTPIEQAILDGATTTGVSIMKLVSKMDAGPVFTRQKLSLSGHESKAELAKELQEIGAQLLLKVLPGLINGSTKAQDQDTSVQPTYSKLIKKSDGIIDWNKPAARIEREIRAFLGWPGSRTTLGGRDVIITRADVESSIKNQESRELALKCGDGQFLVIDRLKPAGKREMTGREFLAGNLI